MTLAVRAAAQDQGLDPLLFSPLIDSAAAGADVRVVQLYRVPLGVHLRTLERNDWGLRLTFPVSFTGLRVHGASDVGGFVKSLGLMSIVPGVELEIPVGTRVLLRPFAEAGIGRGTDHNDVEVLYGTGLRGRTTMPFDHARFMIGGSGMFRKRAASGSEYDGYGTFEAGADGEVPLGFSIGRKAAWGGAYGIARAYDGLDFNPHTGAPIVLTHQFEAGISFSTDPVLRAWKVRLPWLAVGYQFGPVLSGVRVYATFPL